jgi:glycosyltransferase involved in cell wall biosynthesis
VFNAIDWTLMASYSETFGMVTLESMACGTPVIGSDSGGTKSLLNEGKLGLLFETKNPQDLAEKLNNVLTTPSLISKSQLVDSAHSFDYNKICERVEKLLKSNN